MHSVVCHGFECHEDGCRTAGMKRCWIGEVLEWRGAWVGDCLSFIAFERLLILHY